MYFSILQSYFVGTFLVHIILLPTYNYVFRAFAHWEKHSTEVVNPSEEHALRQNLLDYKEKLRINDTVLPDPYNLEEGWMNEGTGKQFWPSLYFSDISDLLQMTTPSELYHRVCNEYKQGKAFR